MVFDGDCSLPMVGSFSRTKKLGSMATSERYIVRESTIASMEEEICGREYF